MSIYDDAAGLPCSDNDSGDCCDCADYSVDGEFTGEIQSPQARWRCACPGWTTARECLDLRYGSQDSDERCECACHEEPYDDGWDG